MEDIIVLLRIISIFLLMGAAICFLFFPMFEGEPSLWQRWFGPSRPVDNAQSRLAKSPTWPHVLKFALRMEAQLEMNRHKGNREGWLKDHPWNLVERVLDETVEVQQCFEQKPDGTVVLVRTPEEAADECADVANFCMMVADRVTVIRCDQCGDIMGNDGPKDGWQVENGRTLCHACCVSDTKNTTQ